MAVLLTSGRGHAETAVWSDNFETNAGSRWTTNSVWHIGSPTAGPAKNAAGFRSYSGTNCAATQNYPYSQDVRLICTNYNGSNSLYIPTNQFPRLRFWHWFNFANALGYVEISSNNGTNWNQISPTYTYAVTPTGGGVWSCPSIDLSAFAGQNVQFAFHFTAGCCSGNALGWYVDDVEVVTSAPVLNNPEGFESDSNTNDWAVDAGTWEIGTPTAGPATNAAGSRAHSGTNCAATILAGNYPNNVDSRLISPPFAVPNSTGQALRFWQWYNFNDALGYVEISTAGSGWTQLSPTYLNVNTGGAWTNVSLNLSAYAGQTVQVAFHFTSGSIGTAAGWYVDDLSVVAAPVLTVPTNQTINAGQTLTVTNFATNSVLPNSTFTFGLTASPSTNISITANGVLTWTNTAAFSGTNAIIYVTVTDTNVPPLAATNNFSVTVLPPPSPTLTVSNTPPQQSEFQVQLQWVHQHHLAD